MRFYPSHLQTAVHLLQQYACNEPFAAFLKKYFSAHRQLGSRDRRTIASYCYAAFRLGPAGKALPPEDRICAGLLLTATHSQTLLEALQPQFNAAVGLPVAEKLKLLGWENRPVHDFFPGAHQLSAGVEVESFVYSHWQQPHLYLRIRPGQASVVHAQLKRAGIPYETLSATTLALPNGTDVSRILQSDRHVVVQDWSSQQTGRLLQTAVQLLQPTDAVVLWDCCAASGGKSLLAADLLQQVQLHVSDVRESILHNLRRRFETAGINRYRLFVADLTRPPQGKQSLPKGVDLLWADVPCSGSGTWGRTPEQLLCHRPGDEQRYVTLQCSILNNVVPALRNGGILLYTTCSAYRCENEEQTQWLQQQYGLQLLEQQVLPGYRHRADTMFAALLRKN